MKELIEFLLACEAVLLTLNDFIDKNAFILGLTASSFVIASACHQGKKRKTKYPVSLFPKGSNRMLIPKEFEINQDDRIDRTSFSLYVLIMSIFILVSTYFYLKFDIKFLDILPFAGS